MKNANIPIDIQVLEDISEVLLLVHEGLKYGHITFSVPDHDEDEAKNALARSCFSLMNSLHRSMIDEAQRLADEVIASNAEPTSDNVVFFPSTPIES